ncbi:MAG: hypothetical protein IKV94_03805 [Clostridia bacterium]|nr:hypothetical protein [Clostridia bacterium]
MGKYRIKGVSTVFNGKEFEYPDKAVINKGKEEKNKEKKAETLELNDELIV